jgi:molybdopterin-guanine dinucleotide biosynthesis protein A
MHSARVDDFIGVVLAGGRSSRMGTNKAFLEYRGKPLIDHMMGLLKEAGAKEVWVSGSLAGYPCIPDEEKFEGPAMAIRHVLKRLRRADVSGVLFVPVDMPALTPELLRELGKQRGGAYYQGWPLPVSLPFKDISPEDKSIKGLLRTLRIPAREVPEGRHACFINVNTPEEWREAAG